jgi:hypothetical protein
MFFSGSGRLLSAVPDRAALVARLDGVLSGRGQGDLLDGAVIAPALHTSPELLDRLLKTAATPQIGLLVAEHYVECPTCQTLNSADDYASGRARGDGYSCSNCDLDLAGLEPSEVTRYRLSAKSLQEAADRRAAVEPVHISPASQQSAAEPLWHRVDFRRDVLRVVLSALLLVCALVGFAILGWPGSVLWLVFLIVAYPLGLAYAMGEPLAGKDLVQIYRIGAAQIPAIGKLLEHIGIGRGTRPPGASK